MKKKAKKYHHKKFKYLVNIEWSEADQAYLAKIPELRGLVTHGETLEEAAKNATDAIATWIEAAQEACVEIPEPIALQKMSGRFVTRIDPEIHRDLVMKAKQTGKTLNGIVSEILEEAVH